jgi:membrane associated rhomboid family serine protease
MMQFKLKPATAFFVSISLVLYLLSLWPDFTDYLQIGGGIIPARFYGSDSDFGAIATVIPVWLTPFTAPFIHSGLLDVVLSSLIFVLLGSMTEEILGWQGIAALVGAGALAGGICVIVLTPDSMQSIIGSRNINAAVIAAYFMLHPIANTAPWGNLSAQQTKYIQLVLLWTILSLATGFPTDFESLAQRVVAPVISFSAGMFLALPLLRWKYRNA